MGNIQTDGFTRDGVNAGRDAYADDEVVYFGDDNDAGLLFDSTLDRVRGTGKDWAFQKHSGRVNAMAYCRGDGITDDTANLQLAADLARDAGLTLLIPDYDYYITGDVYLYTDTDCYGRLIVPGTRAAGSAIHVVRTAAGTSIDPTTLGGLTEGNDVLTGLGSHVGETIIFNSTEVLINRDNVTQPSYNKRDAFVVLNTSSRIAPVLDTTYTDTSLLTVTSYGVETPIVIRGLKIRIQTNGTYKDRPIRVQRGHVTFEDLEVHNATTNALNGCVRADECVGLHFVRPKLDGALDSIEGYAIDLANVSIATLEDGLITNSRRAVGGRNMNDFRVLGGTYHAAIDSHWGRDVVLSGVTVHGNAPFAGSGISVVNSTFINPQGQVIPIRSDTPELQGRVHIENVHVVVNNAALVGSSMTLLGYSSTNETYDFGRTVRNPDLVTIKNVLVTVGGDATALPIRGVHVQGTRDYAQTMWGTVDISNVRVVGSTGPFVVVHLYKNSTYHVKSTTRVRLSDLDFPVIAGSPGGNSAGLTLESRDADVDYGFDLSLRNCKNVYARVDANATVEYVALNCSFYFQLSRLTAQTSIKPVRFYDCEFVTVNFANEHQYEFYSCRYVGAMTSTIGGTLASKTVHAEGGALGTSGSGAPTWTDMPEIATPPAPPANHARVYAKDNGAGKTQLVVLFPTGAEQVISTEP